MEKLKAIIKREYLIRVRSRGFIFGTIASPLLLILYMAVPALMVKMSSHQTHQIAILDQFGDDELYQRIEQLLTKQNSTAGKAEKQGETSRYQLRRELAKTSAEFADKQKLLNGQLESGQLTAYIVLPPDVLQQANLPYFAKNVGDLTTKSRVNDAVNDGIIERRMAVAGLDASRVNDLSRSVELDTINRQGQREEGQTFFLTFGMVMAIYVSILVYGITVMRGVIEEKQWRIIEVLLSSVKPIQLMLGKLIGIGMVGLTQFGVWAATAALLGVAGRMPFMSGGQMPLPNLSPMLLFFFVLYFVLGYFLYATLYAMVGAIVSNEEDGQQMQIPVTMTIVIPIMVSALVMQDPNSLTSTLLSFIPFFSPILMFMRISFQTPPAWQIALSIVLMLATISALLWLAAKIYRVGVLMYGKRPTLPEVARWLKYS